MKHFVTFTVIFGAIIAICSCTDKKGQITVACSDIEKFQSDIGVINIGQKSLGDVMVLDTIQHTAFYLGRLKLSDSQINASTKRDSMVLLSSAKFDFKFEGDVAQAPQDVKASIGSNIENNTTFFLGNCIRKNIQNATADINGARSADLKTYLQVLKTNSSTLIALVTSMTYADRFEFRLKNATSAQVGTNVAKIGNFNLQISYSCQNSLKINAHQDGIFFKVSYFAIDGQDKLVFMTKTLDFRSFKMAQNSIM